MDDKDFLSIRKFSELTGIKQSKLRYYDEVKLFQPVKRGANGYRYYSAPQSIAVNFINVMRSLNIPVKEINKLKEKRTPEQILRLFKKYEIELNHELFRLQQTYAIIHTYSNMIQEGLFTDEHTISIRTMAETPIELGPENDFSSGSFYDSFFQFVNQMTERNVNSAFPAGGYYDSINTFMSMPGQPDRYFSLAPTGRSVKEAGVYIVGSVRGSYGDLGGLPERIQSYAEEQKLKFAGPVYEIYLHDEVACHDPSQYLIQVSAQIKKMP